MKKHLLFLLLPLFVCAGTYAQHTFRKNIGGPANDEGMAIAATFDSGYITAGDTYSFGSGKSDIYIVRFDKNGNILWEKTFGSTDYDHASGVIETSDSGYAVIGTAGSYMCILKISKDGLLQWSEYFTAAKRCGGSSIVQAYDGGYVLGGYAETYDNGSWGYLLKVDSSGHLLWSKKIFNLAGYPSIKHVVKTKDSGYAMIGNNPSPAYDDIYLIKVNKSGNFQWAKSIGGASNDQPAWLEKTNDDGFIIAGSSISFSNGWEMYAIRTDSLGNLRWAKTIGTGSGTNFKSQFSKSVIETKDRGFIFSGTTDSSANNIQSPYVVYLDSLGNIVWTKVIPTEQAVVGYPNIKITALRDGGFAAIGAINTVTAGEDFFLMKFDSSVSLCGGNTSEGTAESHGNMVNQTIPVINAVTSTLFGTFPFVEAPGTENTICSEILPVTLLSFSGKSSGNINTLSWSTAQEINSGYFDLQRSIDGISFSSLGKVNASGNSNIPVNYSLNDAKPAPGKNYYRLRIVDKDGNASFSQIILLRNSSTETNLYPNPVKDKLVLEINSNSDKTAFIQLVNMNGKTVQNFSFGVKSGLNLNSVNTSTLSPGVYILKIIIGTEQQKIKFIKE